MEKNKIELKNLTKEELLNMKSEIENIDFFDMNNTDKINLKPNILDIDNEQFVKKINSLEKLNLPKFDINNKFLDENTDLDDAILTEEDLEEYKRSK